MAATQKKRRNKKAENLKRLLWTNVNVFVIDTEFVTAPVLNLVQKTFGGGLFIGNNKLMRQSIRLFCAANPDSKFMQLLPAIFGQAALVFTNDDWAVADEALRSGFKIIPRAACFDFLCPSRMKGTTIISVFWKDSIFSVADGRGMVGHKIAAGNIQKLKAIHNNKYIASAAGDRDYGESKIKEMEKELGQYSPLEVIDRIKKEAIDWPSCPKVKELEKEYPISISLNGFDGDKVYILLAGDESLEEPFDIDVGGKIATVSVCGTGAEIAAEHFRGLVKNAKFPNVDMVDCLKQCIAAAGCEDLDTGGHIQIARLLRGSTVKFDSKKPHMVEQIAYNFINLKLYFRNCMLIMFEGIPYPDQLDFELHVARTLQGVVFMNALGVHLKNLKTLWVIRFDHKRSLKDAFERVSKDIDFYKPEVSNSKKNKRKKRKVVAQAPRQINFEVYIPSEEVFQKLRTEFVNHSW